MYLTNESLHGNNKAKFILVKDSCNLRGMKIFKSVMTIYSKEDVEMAVLCYDGVIDDLSHGLNLNPDKSKLLDIFSDPNGWYEGDVLDSLMSVDFILEYFYDFKGVLCIYSLTSLLIHNGFDKVYRMLHKLLNSNDNLQIVALLHSDVHDLPENVAMDRIASTTLCMNPDKDEETLLCTVHYTSGKVKSLLLEYDISEEFEFLSLVDFKLQNKVNVRKPDPTANLTFNLRLKNEEKEARKQVELPFLMKSKDAVLQNFLENDMYDEEDPDDDLDI